MFLIDIELDSGVKLITLNINILWTVKQIWNQIEEHLSKEMKLICKKRYFYFYQFQYQKN